MSLFSRNDSACKLVFDIGSGSVGGAIVLASDGSAPTVLYSFRSEIPFQTEAVGSRLLSLMLRSLAQVTLALVNEGFEAAGLAKKRPKISETFVSLSAPWTTSRTSLLSFQSREPVRITKDIFIELLRHSEDELRETRKGALKGSAQIERELVTSVLNGYESAAPYEKTAREANFTLFRSFSPARVTGAVVETITSLVHTGTLHFHSFAFLLFSAMRRLPAPEKHFLAMDVSGEQTELLSVAGGAPVQAATFPLGRNRLIRALGKGAGLPPSVAASLIGLYVEEKGSGKLFERVKRTLARAETEWVSEYLRALQDFSEEALFPTTVFIAADSDVMPIFTRAVLRADGARFPVAVRGFRAVPVQSELLSPLVAWSSPDARDPFIGVVASFARLRNA